MEDLSEMKHFVGCDVSKETLDFGIFLPKTDSRRFPHTRVPNTPEGYRQAMAWLRTHGVDKSAMVVGMEHTGYYSCEFSEWLHGKGVRFVMLHPMAVKRCWSEGRNKTDKADAQFIADYVYTQREKLSPSQPEAPAIKALRMLISERRLAVKSKVMCQNLRDVQGKGAGHKRLSEMIKTHRDNIRAIEKDMLALICSIPELRKTYELLTSIPGVGLINAAAAIVATGNFERFQTARQYAKFCKVAPLEKSSGTSVRGGAHVPSCGHTELKTLLTDAARSAIVHDPQIKAYYERKRAQGKSHGCVLNAVKFKLVCRMFSVVKRGEKYVNTEKFRS